jgi:hypothetical protein
VAVLIVIGLVATVSITVLSSKETFLSGISRSVPSEWGTGELVKCDHLLSFTPPSFVDDPRTSLC